MSPIDHFDLRNFDLNLLVAFDALVEDRSVTRAAARLRVQQPAMSHSLATLRVLLDDPLFVRVGQEMRPTARALALAPRVRDALRQLQDAVREADAFDPRTQDRVFRLGCSGGLEVLALPGLTAHLRACAPGVRLVAHTAGPDVHRLLDEGALDVAVGYFDDGASRHHGADLFGQAPACCFNPRLLDGPPPLDVETYLHTSHALVALNDRLQGCLDEALTRVGATLDVVMTGTDYLTVLAAAARAPVLATVPARLARRYAPAFGLAVSPVPLPLRIPAVSMIWSARSDRDPGAAWLRGQITALLADDGD